MPADREIVLRGVTDQEDAGRAFVAAMDCGEDHGTFVVDVKGRTSGRIWKYRVRAIKTRIIVEPYDAD